MRTTFALTVALALALTGCITNMAGLKESLGDANGTTPETGEPLDRSATTPDATTKTNATTIVQRPPVARISIYESNGALLFKSTFTAENSTEIVFVNAKTTLSLIAGDSEAVERGANLTGFAWTVNGKPLEGDRQAKLEIAEPGVYAIMLKVTDSNGKSDTQSAKVALLAEPYEVVEELMSGQIVGQEGDAPADLAWELASPEEPATVQSVTIVARFPTTCDGIVELVAADGTSMGSSDAVGIQDLDNTETLELGSIAFGKYTIRLAPYTCVATEVPVTVTTVLVPVVPGLEGAGHGEHAGH